MAQTINSPEILKAGAYSHAVISNGLVFLSGQTGNTAGIKSSFSEQFQGAMERISNILKLSESSLDSVVKCNVYLANASDFQKMNELYAKYFTKNPPARTTIVTGFPSPEVLVEIDVVAELFKQKTTASSQWPFS